MEQAVVTRMEAQPSSVLTPMELLDRAFANNAAPETLERLMALQERWEKSQARKAFDEAVAAAKAEFTPIARNKKGHNEKRYADFSAIASMVDPIISKHGLSYRFRTVQNDRIHVTCILAHKQGHNEETTLAGPADTTGNKNAIQAIGSTLTYLQRYSLMQALGVAASDDDDGRAGGQGETITQEQADKLREILEAKNKDRAKFLKWAKVDKIEDIQPAFYQSCIDAANYNPVQS